MPRVLRALELVAAVNAPLHPDKAFYLVPSSWYLLLRHLSNPSDFPPPKKLPVAGASEASPTLRMLKSPKPAESLLDRQGLLDASNPFYGTCQPEGITNEFKLLPGLVEFRDSDKKGKDVADEPEGDIVFVEESGWGKIVEWSVHLESISHELVLGTDTWSLQVRRPLHRRLRGQTPRRVRRTRSPQNRAQPDHVETIQCCRIILDFGPPSIRRQTVPFVLRLEHPAVRVASSRAQGFQPGRGELQSLPHKVVAGSGQP